MADQLGGAGVVEAYLETTAVSFGAVRLRQVRVAPLRLRRSDGRRGRLWVEIPPDLQGVLRCAGHLLLLRHLQPQPLRIDQELPVYDRDLDDRPVGRVRVTAECLAPRLLVELPVVKVVPEYTATANVRVRDAGGGLRLGRVTSDQPWLRVRQRGLQVALTVHSAPGERGRKYATLTFPSNDHVEPVQRHRLTVLLLPPWQRLVTGSLRRAAGWVRRPARWVSGALRSRPDA